MLVLKQREQLPVQEARAGEPEAWDALFRRYQLPLYSYVFELVRDEQSALDVVQEAFINAARYLDSLQSDDRFGSWLFGIAHQKCIQCGRRRSRQPLWDDSPQETLETLPDAIESPDDILVRREQEQTVMKLIEQLPWPQRSVLLLYFIEDFSIEEIARITQTSAGTVKSRLHYGKKALRESLEKTDENTA